LNARVRSVPVTVAAANRMEAVRRAALERHRESINQNRESINQQRRQREESVSAAKLEEVEERLLAAAIEKHPRSAAAIDRLNEDAQALTAAVDESRRTPLLLRSTANLNRMEELMLEAVVRTHANRDRALDRLLDDIADDATMPTDWIPAPLGEHFVDNDYDGMA